MNPQAHIRRGEECRTCLIPHDPAIHEATRSLHAWLRERHAGPAPEPAEGPLRIKAPAPAGRPLNERTRESKRTPRSDLTFEHVIECLRRGESFREIARGRMVSGTAVARCIDRAVARSQRNAEMYKALLVCPRCNEGKNPSASACYGCLKAARSAEVQAVNRRADVSDERLIEMRAAGMSYAAIGSAVNMHPSTIHQRLSRCANVNGNQNVNHLVDSSVSS